MSQPALAVEGVCLQLGAFALREISFSLAPGEVFVILGPSGAGKSILLETIAGFHRPAPGSIRLAGRDVTHAPPERRRIGFMFQDYALFPHLSVAQNIKFGLQFRRHQAVRRGQPQVQELLRRLDLEGIADRKTINLSGGEKQRVALARALAIEPELFLFDEPLSALDAPTRDSLRGELKTLLHELNIATVYVTHDQTEALTLADRMAVARDGSLLQVGTPTEIFSAPADPFVARFVGVDTIIEGRVLSVKEGLVSLELPGQQRLEAIDNGTGTFSRVLVCIRPEDVALARSVPSGSSVRNRFRARVESVEALGPLLKIRLDCGFPLAAYVTKQSYLELGLAPGTPVVACVKTTAVHLIGQR